jgi:hypothetical protein
MQLVQVQCARISSLSSEIQFPYSTLIYPPPFSIAKYYKLEIIRLIFAANSGKPVQYRGRILSGFSPGPSLESVVKLSQNLSIPEFSQQRLHPMLRFLHIQSTRNGLLRSYTSNLTSMGLFTLITHTLLTQHPSHKSKSIPAGSNP